MLTANGAACADRSKLQKKKKIWYYQRRQPGNLNSSNINNYLSSKVIDKYEPFAPFKGKFEGPFVLNSLAKKNPPNQANLIKFLLTSDMSSCGCTILLEALTVFIRLTFGGSVVLGGSVELLALFELLQNIQDCIIYQFTGLFMQFSIGREEGTRI